MSEPDAIERADALHRRTITEGSHGLLSALLGTKGITIAPLPKRPRLMATEDGE